jgi:hypothetical protein
MLSGYGEKFGLAFQVTDDILDVEGDSLEMGKTAGADAKRRKATYPGLLGLDQAKAWARRLVEGPWLRSSPWENGPPPCRNWRVICWCAAPDHGDKLCKITRSAGRNRKIGRC